MSDDDDEEAEGLCARLLERDDGFTPAGIIMRGCWLGCESCVENEKDRASVKGLERRWWELDEVTWRHVRPLRTRCSAEIASTNAVRCASMTSIISAHLRTHI